MVYNMSDRVSLLPGSSAFEWQRREDIGVRIGAVAAVVGIVGVVAGLAGGILPVGLAGMLTLLVGGGFGRLSAFGFLGSARSRKERAAGYTTLAEPHQPAIPLVSYRSGRVVRAIDAPAMSSKDYQNAVSLEAL